MSAIAGLLGFPKGVGQHACGRMLDSLEPYAGGDSAIWAEGGIVLGQRGEPRRAEGVHRLSGSRVLVADLRLYNRRELLLKLGLSEREAVRIGDSALAALAWEAWNERCLQEIVGDYAFALWDGSRRQLSLVRSPFGDRPLFFHHAQGRTAFATMPRALAATPGFAPELDFRALAADIDRIPRQSSQTIYKGVQRAEPGCITSFSAAGMGVERFWAPRTDTLAGSPQDLGEELARQLRRSLEDRVAWAGPGPIAAQLSAGRDSGAVAVTAAAVLAEQGRSLLALTGAPAEGTLLPDDGINLFDESGVAAATARLHPNIDHRVARPQRPFSFETVARLCELNQFPIGILSNVPWQAAIMEEVRAAGAGVMFQGQLGNATVSAGGASFLPDLLREAGWRKWLSALWQHAGHHPATMFRRGLRSLAPAQLYEGYRPKRGAAGQSLLQPHVRREISRDLAVGPPPRVKFGREELAQALNRFDQAQVLSDAFWGIRSIDATADVRLAEFCLRLPATELVGAGDGRPAYERAFAGKLAEATLQGERRGYQGADWFRFFGAELIEEALERVSSTDLRELVDLRLVRQLGREWPNAHSSSPLWYETFRVKLLLFIATAALLSTQVSTSRLPVGRTKEP